MSRLWLIRIGSVVNFKKIQHLTETSSRVINDDNIKKFETDISAVDWNFVNNYDSADEKFDAFEKKYSELYDRNFPIKAKKGKPGRR